MFTVPILLLLLLLISPNPCECPIVPNPSTLSTLDDRWQEASDRLAKQWQNPNDVLTVLLIIGGDIVQKALAQLSGGHFVPVAFSFGWVSYSFNALLAAYGEGALMPATAYPSLLVDADSGYSRANYSWILNRILRSVESELEPLDAALCVTVFRARPFSRQRMHDWIWWSGMVTIFVQVSIAGVPCAIEGDWSIITVTILGIVLALVGGALPQ